MRADRKCSSVKLERPFDLILLRAKNEASQTGASPGGKQGERSPLPKPGKFAKDNEHPTPQPAMRINTRRKSKFSLNFSKFLLKFSLKISQFFKSSKNF